MNNQSIFDIFDYLGIPVTDNLETVQKALDDLPANKMVNLHKNPEFTKMRKFLYAKKATNEFLAYVQTIRDLRDPAKQEQLRQEQLRQEQLRQVQLRQVQLRQEQLRQEQLRQEQLRQEQLRQEQLRQEQLRQDQILQEQIRLQQQYQSSNQQQQYQSNYNSSNNQQPADGCGKAIGGLIMAVGVAIWQGAQYVWQCIVYLFSSIWAGIKYIFVSLTALLGFGPHITTSLDMPEIINIDNQLKYVEVQWNPVNYADYYVVHLESIYSNETNRGIDESQKNEDDIIVRDKLSVVLKRDDFFNKKYTITACSDNSKYGQSLFQMVTVEPRYNIQNPFSDFILSVDKIPNDIYELNKSRISTLDIKPPQKEWRFYSECITDYKNPSAPHLQAVSIKNGAIITWNDVDYAHYYQLKIQVGENRIEFVKKIYVESKMHNYFYILKKLDPDTVYYISVIAVPYNDQQYSPVSSNTVSIKLDIN